MEELIFYVTGFEIFTMVKQKKKAPLLGISIGRNGNNAIGKQSHRKNRGFTSANSSTSLKRTLILLLFWIGLQIIFYL